MGLSHAFSYASARIPRTASLQLRMLASAGGEASRIRAFTREEAEGLRDQITGGVARRAWEYLAAVAHESRLGSARK